MIGSLRGVVLKRTSEGTALLEVAGIGYIVIVSPKTLAELEPTLTCFMYIHHHIREESQTLFGFLTADEKSTFQVLISTHGVGPSLAMAILATHEPHSLYDIVAASDIESLMLVPGVGKKTAERLLVELKNRLSIPSLAHIVQTQDGWRSSTAVGDVREALIGLGYHDQEIREAMRDMAPTGTSADILRDALQVLGSRRA